MEIIAKREEKPDVDRMPHLRKDRKDSQRPREGSNGGLHSNIQVTGIRPYANLLVDIPELKDRLFDQDKFHGLVMVPYRIPGKEHLKFFDMVTKVLPLEIGCKRHRIYLECYFCRKWFSASHIHRHVCHSANADSIIIRAQAATPTWGQYEIS